MIPFKITLIPMTEEHAKLICSWRYEGSYALYNWSPWEQLEQRQEEFADPEIRASQYLSAVDSDGRLCGFVQLFPLLGVTRLGLGLRPDLCGLGYGKYFMETIVQEVQRRKPEDEIDLEVLVWNIRAIRAYERAGFERTDTYVRQTPTGPDEFHCMVYRNRTIKSNKRY